MFSKFSCLIRRFAVVIGMFLCAGAAVGDVNNKEFLIDGKLYGENVYWPITLEAGSAGGLFGDTLGPVRTFRYETVVKVDGKEIYLITVGMWR